MAETLQSVRRALSILAMLQDEGDLGVTEVATRMHVGQATAHRLLGTLAEADFVRRDSATHRYHLGRAMRSHTQEESIAHCVFVAQSQLPLLRDATGETIHVAALDHHDGVRFVAGAESHQVLRVGSRVGRTLPLLDTASGQVLLAHLPDHLLGVVLRASGLAEDDDDLLRHLALIKERGWADNLGRAEPGASIAVPIHGPYEQPLCALTLAGPESRLGREWGDGEVPTSERAKSLLAHLTDTSERISGALQF